MPQTPGPTPRFNLRCTSCGYGVHVRKAPDRCPMCGGAQWEHAGTELLGRLLQARLRGEAPDIRTLFRDLNLELASGADAGELELVCECGDGRCFEAVALTREDFDVFAGSPGQHVVAPGHETPDEVVVAQGSRFAVVAASAHISAGRASSGQ